MPLPGSRAHMAHWPLADDLLLSNHRSCEVSTLFILALTSFPAGYGFAP